MGSLAGQIYRFGFLEISESRHEHDTSNKSLVLRGVEKVRSSRAVWGSRSPP